MKYIQLLKIESWKNLKSEYMNYLSLLCVEDEGKICEEVTLNLNFEEEKQSVLYEVNWSLYSNPFYEEDSPNKAWSMEIKPKFETTQEKTV